MLPATACPLVGTLDGNSVSRALQLSACLEAKPVRSLVEEPEPLGEQDLLFCLPGKLKRKEVKDEANVFN